MKCSEIRKKLSEYLEKDLPADTTSAVDEHLKGCSDCSRELEIHRKTWQALDLWEEIEPSPNFLPGVVKKMEEPGLFAKILSLFTFRVPAWSAAALMIALFISGYYLSPPRIIEVKQPPQIVYVNQSDSLLASAMPTESLNLTNTLPDVDNVLTVQESEAASELPVTETWEESGSLQRVQIEDILDIPGST